MKKLKILSLYPDMLGLYGDRGNLWAFERAARAMGAQIEFSRADNFSDTLELDDVDIIYAGSCEIRVAQSAATALEKDKASLANYLARGGVIFCTGNSSLIFCGEVKRRNGESFCGLGLVDASFSELRAVYSNDAVFTSEIFGNELEVVGGQLQLLKVFVGEHAQALGKNVYGYGNKKSDDEGIVSGGFIATNYQGPVLVKNPWFACELLRRAAKAKNIELADPDPKAFELERASNERIKQFIALKIAKYDKTRLNNEE